MSADQKADAIGRDGQPGRAVGWAILADNNFEIAGCIEWHIIAQQRSDGRKPGRIEFLQTLDPGGRPIPRAKVGWLAVGPRHEHDVGAIMAIPEQPILMAGVELGKELVLHRGCAIDRVTPCHLDQFQPAGIARLNIAFEHAARIAREAPIPFGAVKVVNVLEPVNDLASNLENIAEVAPRSAAQQPLGGSVSHLSSPDRSGCAPP